MHFSCWSVNHSSNLQSPKNSRLICMSSFINSAFQSKYSHGKVNALETLMQCLRHFHRGNYLVKGGNAQSLQVEQAVLGQQLTFKKKSKREGKWELPWIRFVGIWVVLQSGPKNRMALEFFKILYICTNNKRRAPAFGFAQSSHIL